MTALRKVSCRFNGGRHSGGSYRQGVSPRDHFSNPIQTCIASSAIPSYGPPLRADEIPRNRETMLAASAGRTTTKKTIHAGIERIISNGIDANTCAFVASNQRDKLRAFSGNVLTRHGQIFLGAAEILSNFFHGLFKSDLGPEVI